MQLAKALLGAIIGAVVGIVLLIVVYLTTGRDWTWLAIPFALVTGLGVRMFVDTKGHASYVRGAMTLAFALAAYIGGWLLVAPIVMARAKAIEKPAVDAAANQEPGAEDSKDADAADTESKDEEGKDADTTDAAALPKVVVRPADSGVARAATPRPVNYSPTDIICLAIAALVAYELGRGSGASVPSVPPPSSSPAGMHPDA
jgi:hypothetical protein